MKPIAIEYDKTMYLHEGRHLLKDKINIDILTEYLDKTFTTFQSIRTTDELKYPMLILLPLINSLLPMDEKLTEDDIDEIVLKRDHMEIKISQNHPVFMGSFKISYNKDSSSITADDIEKFKILKEDIRGKLTHGE